MPIFGTVRRKLTALVAFSAAAALVVVPLLSWLMHRQLLDEVKVRVPAAIAGFDEELGDDLKDLDVTANVLGATTDVERALAARDAAALVRLARPFNDAQVGAYPDIDIVFYDAAGKLVSSSGCEHPRDVLPPEIGAAHSLLVHGCETADRAPIAIALTRKVGAAGTVLVCLPLDRDYFENSLTKLNRSVVGLAMTEDGELSYASDSFPTARIADARGDAGPDERSSGAIAPPASRGDAGPDERSSGAIAPPASRGDAGPDERSSGAIAMVEVDGASWAIHRFTPKPIAAEVAHAPTRLAFYIARDVTRIKKAVRTNLYQALAILGAATVISLAIGWRLASRMSRALTRVARAMERLEKQEYVKVDVVKTGDELEDLANGFNAMVDGLQERDKLRTTMGKYMTEAVVAHLMAGEVELGGKTLEVSILFCDLRDFTTLSEKRNAQEIVGLLNEYFTDMVDCVMAEGGVVDKYIGDNIMAVFGAPVSRPDDAVRAVRAAVRMRDALVKLNARFAERGLPALRFGIGIHTGEVVAGNIGSAKRMEYTVIGDAVNVAARLESKTKELACDVLISDATYARAKDAIDGDASGEVHVKGRQEPVTIYKVRGLVAKAA